jgi:hypothetical protein
MPLREVEILLLLATLPKQDVHNWRLYVRLRAPDPPFTSPSLHQDIINRFNRVRQVGSLKHFPQVYFNRAGREVMGVSLGAS